VRRFVVGSIGAIASACVFRLPDAVGSAADAAFAAGYAARCWRLVDPMVEIPHAAGEPA
jgi:hypothetical protein